MKLHRAIPVTAALTALAICAPVHGTTVADTKVVSENELRQHVLLVQDVDQRGNIHGVVKNLSDRAIEDIDLLVRYSWVWESPDHQKPNDPSFSEFVDLNGKLEPGESMPFTYRVGKPLPERKDGDFMPRVDVVGVKAIR